MARVLVVEDVVEVQELVTTRLHRAGHVVRSCAAVPEEAVELLRACRPEVCVVDVALPGDVGMEVLRALRAAEPEMHVIACTRAGVGVNVFEAIRGGASAVVSTVHGLERALATAHARRPGPTLSAA